VLFLTNIPSPYRVDFFNEMGENCKLTVLFERKTATGRNSEWTYNKITNFNAVFLKGMKFGKGGSLCPTVINWLSRKKFDIIVLGVYHTPTAMLAINFLKVKKIPFFLNSDGGIIKKDRKVIYHLKKYLIGSATWWLSTGQETNKYLNYYGSDSSKTLIYPFSSLFEEEILKKPVTMKEKMILRQELDLKGEKIVLGVGQFIQRKGFDILLRIWSKINPNYTLILIGGGVEEKKYLSYLEKHKTKNVIVEDFKSKDLLKKYYQSSDLFILPTREDIWGLVINEAMANGLPVISTNKCVSALELLDEDNKIITPINEVELLQKVSTILEDSSLALEIGKKNLETIKSYTIEKMVEKHILFFEKALKTKNN